MLSWRRADATHTMPSTSRASSNSSTTASYTRAITPYTHNTHAITLQFKGYSSALIHEVPMVREFF